MGTFLSHNEDGGETSLPYAHAHQGHRTVHNVICGTPHIPGCACAQRPGTRHDEAGEMLPPLTPPLT